MAEEGRGDGKCKPGGWQTKPAGYFAGINS